MASDENALAVGQARERYFEAAGMSPGYDDAWVRFKVGPVPLAFPNAPGRLRAVLLHDLHHVATGYDTSWTGEAEIGGWELAAGCAHHRWAWFLNLQAFALGLGIAPLRVARAFYRGRHSQTLYNTVGEFDDSLLSQTLGALRRELGLDHAPPAPRPSDCLALVGFALASLAVSVLPLLLIGGAAWVVL